MAALVFGSPEAKAVLQRDVRLRRRTACDVCGGDTRRVICPDCDGEGITFVNDYGNYEIQPCSMCNGVGHWYECEEHPEHSGGGL